MRLLLRVLAASVLVSTGLVVPPSAGAASDGAGTSMMLVLDASGSMAEPAGGGGGSRIDAAREGLNALIDALPAGQKVGFRVFGATDLDEDDPRACTDTQRIVDLGSANRDRLRRAVAEYEPVGWTPTSAALQQAAKDLGRSGQRTIVLVSDGEPTCDPDPCTVAGSIVAAGVDVRIDVIGLDVSGAARKTLRCVAREGRGTYYDADDAASITKSLTETSARAARPFDLTGVRVRGGSSPASAPTLTTGQYVDTVAESGVKTYRLRRTIDGSTLHAGLVLEGTPAVVAGVLHLRIARESDASCNGASSFGLGLSSRVPILYGGTFSWKPDPADRCNTDDRLVLTTEAVLGDIGGNPVELAVYEEPPITSPLSERDAPAAPRWQTLEVGAPTSGVVPGTSIASAPVLEPGTYSFDITAGETQVVGVPVDWGQDLQAQFDARLTPAVIKAAGLGSEISVRILSPMRAEADVASTVSRPADWTGDLGFNRDVGDYRTGAQSYVVHPANRATDDPRRREATLPGVHYVQVALKVGGDEANLPYSLTLARNTVIEGTAAAPTYEQVAGLTPPTAGSRLVTSPVGSDGVATTPTHGATAVASPSEQPAAAPAPEGAGTPGWLLVVPGVALVGALGIGGWLLVRRRSAGGTP